MRKILFTVLTLAVFAGMSFAQNTSKKNQIVIGNGNGGLIQIDTGKTQQLLQSNGKNPPSWVTVGSNLSFSHDTLNATGGGGGGKQWERAGIKGAAGLSAGTTHYIAVNQLLTYNDANVTTYDCSNPSNNQIDGAGYYPIGGTLKNFYFRGNVPGSGKTFTITVMKNGTATSATYTVANTDVDGSGNGLKSDLTHTITVAAGDLITYRIVTLAGANSFTGNMVSEFDSN